MFSAVCATPLALALVAALALPASADVITGKKAPEFLVGKTEPSTIRGNAGDDVIYGDTAEVFLAAEPILLSTSTSGDVGTGFLDDGNITGAFSISGNGRYVAFASSAPNLVAGDVNTFNDVFVKDVKTGALVLVSRNGANVAANAPSSSPALSPDGQYVAFVSTATNLVLGDTTGTQHVYLKNIQTAAITRLSTSTTGTIGNSGSFDPVFSPDGTQVAFRSLATNLVGQPTFDAFQLYVRTIATGATQIISVNAAGKAGAGDSFRPAFSPDSRKVAFHGYAPDLVAGDTNKSSDVFVKTLASTAIVRISLNATGREREADSFQPTFAPDGERVAFVSGVNDFVASDNNGTADVFVKSLTSGSIRLVSVNPDGTQSPVQSSQPVFSPDGSKIAFTRVSTIIFDTAASTPAATLDKAGVYIRDLDNGALTAVDVETVTVDTTDYPSEPRFFPSGTRLAYFRNTLAGCNDLARCRSQIEARRLTDVPGSADLLVGGAGNDKLVGGPGNDFLRAGTGNDTMLGGTGNDTMVPGPGENTMLGDDGADTVDYSAETRPLVVNLKLGTARIEGALADRLTSVENVIGGSGDDVLKGNSAANVFVGGLGSDQFDGGSDNPLVIDTVDYSTAPGPIRLQFAAGRVLGHTAKDSDFLVRTAKGFRIHQVIGSRFDDVMDGSRVNLARMEGGPGNDWIIGGGGGGTSQRVVYQRAKSAVFVDLAKGIGRNRKNGDTDVGRDKLVDVDMVSGSAFGDILIGNAKANVFNGNGGSDRMRGGAGPDEFFYLTASDSPNRAPDVIVDFSSDDFINVKALGVTKLVSGPIPAGPAKLARFRRVGPDGVLDIDLDGDAEPEMGILLKGVVSFSGKQILLQGELDP